MSRWDVHEFTAAARTRVHAALLGPPGAPEVVCVHGLGCSYRYWLPFARALAPAPATGAEQCRRGTGQRARVTEDCGGTAVES